MAKYPTPNHPGWFWAKLIHPREMPETEDWRSVDWEVVMVNRNIIEMDGKAREEGISEFTALVAGITPAQNVEDFVWGPEILKFTENNDFEQGNNFMQDPIIHSHCTDILSNDHLRAFTDIECFSCHDLIHAENNECMQTWVETGLGPYCLPCFAGLTHNGDASAYWLPGDPEIRKTRGLPNWP